MEKHKQLGKIVKSVENANLPRILSNPVAYQPRGSLCYTKWENPKMDKHRKSNHKFTERERVRARTRPPAVAIPVCLFLVLCCCSQVFGFIFNTSGFAPSADPNFNRNPQ